MRLLLRRFVVLLLLVATALFVSTLEAHAFTDAQAVHAIMGEARGESYIGKIALGEALRRRGTLSGVYGKNVSLSLLKLEKQAIWVDALKAWQASKTSNLVPGCKYWFSDADLVKLRAKSPRWFRQLRFVKKVGNHSFYKEWKSYA